MSNKLFGIQTDKVIVLVVSSHRYLLPDEIGILIVALRRVRNQLGLAVTHSHTIE